MNAFKSVKNSRGIDIQQADPKNFKKTLTAAGEYTLAYLDSSQYTQAQITRILKDPKTGETCGIGIIDAAGTINDPASLFFQGSVDYLPKALIKQGITPARLKKTASYCNFETAPQEKPAKSAGKVDLILSGSSWKDVKSGKEYTFCFLYIEIDLIDEWKIKSGHAHLDEVKAAFLHHVEQFAEMLSGKIWMWMDLYGVILFPFDGTACKPILECIRLVLNRTIISAEQYHYTTTISYKLALHIGNTLYRSRGNTGTIVSDSVNFLFHLGHQFTKPGNFYLTDPVSHFIPKNIEDCFIPAGSFEDIDIMRMRLPKTGK